MIASPLRLTLTLGLVAAALAACSDDDDGPTGPEAGGISCAENSATYTLTFQSVWSAQTHPEGFPSNPHFSGLIGATHRATVSFWDPESLASPGIQAMAELGRKSPLDEEVQAAIDSGDAARIISGGEIALSPGSVEVEFTMDPGYPLVTVVSMIAPSPDWFVGVRGLSLCAGGEWVDSLTVNLYAYDAGTDSGDDYTSLNQPTVPPEPIFRIEERPFLVNAQIPILGTFRFVRK